MALSLSRRSRAFTLVELLVSIGVIVVLISILVPTIGKAQRAAQTTGCLSNQRQIMTASIAYSRDNHGYLPFDGWQSSGVPNWLYHKGKPITYTTVDLQYGQLWPYLLQEKAYRCPGDTGPWPAQYSTNWSSYIMNGANSGFSNNGNIALPLDRFKENDVLYWEVPMTTGVAGTHNDADEFPNEGLTARHQGGTVAAHMDGHVDVITAAEFINLCQKGPTMLWCDPTAADGGFSKFSNKPNPIPVQY